MNEQLALIYEELKTIADLQRASLMYAWRTYEATLALLPQDRAESLAAAHERGVWMTRPPFATEEE